MIVKYLSVTLMFWLFCPHVLLTQNAPNWLTFNQIRLKKQQTAMTVLGTWAVANMATGAILQNQTVGERHYFYQMNLIWNTVNLTLAGTSLLTMRKTNLSNLDAAASIKAQHRLQKILLFNAGLDMGYIALGAWYIEHGKNTTDPKLMHRRKGYGKSIVLQGAFLFAFDLLTVRALTKDNKKIPQLLEGLSFSRHGFYFQKKF